MPTRLASRLLLSHAVLAVILFVALSITTMGLVQMNRLIVEVRDDELGDIEYEERLHRAAWLVETEARRGILLCEQDRAQEPQVRERLREATAALGRVLAEENDGTSERMHGVASRYLQFAERMVASETCPRLQKMSVGRERLLLDEELTETWISRMRELHAAIHEKEAQTQRIGAFATVVGVLLALLACVAAALVARWVARGVTVPLSRLASHARRVGEGDFSPPPAIDGPYEVRDLYRELDGMRDRLAQVEQLKQAFMAAVSHDLRTPLAQLRQALSLLSDGTLGELNDRQARVVALAHRACEREIGLVATLLDVSRVRAGRLRKERSALDAVIERAVAHVQTEAREAGVAIALEREGEIPEAELDALVVERALVNLINNAVSVCLPGQTVRVHRAYAKPPAALAAKLPGVAWARILVRDPGPGVAPELRARIFEPFFTHPAGYERQAGIGLGLPLACELIRAHGGDIELLEQTEPGATFALWLPLDGIMPPSTVAKDVPSALAS